MIGGIFDFRQRESKMGMYTELIFGASLKEDTPINVIDTLRYMVGDIDKLVEPAIDLDRNPLQGGSYSFGVNTPVSKLLFSETTGEWMLSARANIKNYCSSIEKFLEWIKPYISSGSGCRDMYAIVIYEEDDTPTMHYLNSEESK